MTIDVIVAPTMTETRLLVSEGQDERMRAMLGTSCGTHPKAMTTLLEGLSLWFESRLHVVLYVDGPGSCSLGLCAHGQGDRTLYYEVDVVEAEPRDPPVRLRGGERDFRRLRRLAGLV